MGKDRRAHHLRPNILLIIADDLRPDLISAYGNEHFTKLAATPNLDQLASEGVRFDQAFTTSPLCAPARFSLNTGHYNSRRVQVTKKRKVPTLLGSVLAEEDQLYYVTNNGMLSDSEVAFYKTRTLGAALRSYGYNTGGVGKWHMGSSLYNDAFNFSYLMATNSQDYAQWGISPGAPSHNPEEFTYQALKWLEQQTGTTPWFLYLALTLPHSPYDMRQLLADDPNTGQEPFLGSWERDARGLRSLNLTRRRLKFVRKERQALQDDLQARGWLDGIAEKNKYEASMGALLWLDREIGKVLAKMADLRLNRRTLVVFTADHGIVLPLGVGKGSLHNEGIRIPMIMRWTGHIASSTVADVPVTVLDLFPTFLELAGSGSEKANVELQGNSLVPVLFNSQPTDSQLTFRPLFFEVGIARAVLLGGWKFISVGPASATADGDVCAEAFGDYMSEPRTLRLEKTYFCHTEICSAEQLYRYAEGCEQVNIRDKKATSDRLRVLLQEHIQKNEGGRRYIVNDETAESTLTFSNVTYENQPGRLGCGDKYMVESDQEAGAESCDYRWHSFFADLDTPLRNEYLRFSNSSDTVPTGVFVSYWSVDGADDLPAVVAEQTAWGNMPTALDANQDYLVASPVPEFIMRRSDDGTMNMLNELTKHAPPLGASTDRQPDIRLVSNTKPTSFLTPTVLPEDLPGDGREVTLAEDAGHVKTSTDVDNNSPRLAVLEDVPKSIVSQPYQGTFSRSSGSAGLPTAGLGDVDAHSDWASVLSPGAHAAMEEARQALSGTAMDVDVQQAMQEAMDEVRGLRPHGPELQGHFGHRLGPLTFGR